MSIKKLTTEQEMSVKALILSVCDRYVIEEKTLLRSTTRKREIIEKRQVLQYLLYRITNLSLSQVGSLFEHKYNHATVLNSVRRYEEQINIYPDLYKEVENLKSCYLTNLSKIKNNTQEYQFTFIDLDNAFSMVGKETNLLLTGFTNEEVEKINKFICEEIGYYHNINKHENTTIKFYSTNKNQ